MRRIFTLKYEDLIADPVVDGEVMGFLGAELESRQLEYYRRKVLDHSRRSGSGGIWRASRWWEQGKYRNELGTRNIEIFEGVAACEMEALGYRSKMLAKRAFTHSDVRLFRTIAFLRKQFWSMDPSPEALGSGKG